jgi:hypothetical protein
MASSGPGRRFPFPIGACHLPPIPDLGYEPIGTVKRTRTVSAYPLGATNGWPEPAPDHTDGANCLGCSINTLTSLKFGSKSSKIDEYRCMIAYDARRTWIQRGPAHGWVRRSAQAGVVGLVTLLSACGGPPPANPDLPTEFGPIERAMNRAAPGHVVVHSPTAAAHPRGRWQDVDLAVYWALGDAGVEMAELSHDEFEWGFEYRLKTIEGLPALFRVEQRPAPEIYWAEASVGRFPGVHADRERALVDAFEKWMRELGRKLVYPAPDRP